MILYIRRVCVFLTLVLLSAECYSIRINYIEDELPKEKSSEYTNNYDSTSIEDEKVENPPAPLPLKIQLPEDVRDNLLLKIFSDDNLSKLFDKATSSKNRVARQASAPPLYPNLTPSPYQSQSVQYYNNSSPNSNSQYGHTNPYNQQWQHHNNTQRHPAYPSQPSYNPNTYGPSGIPNPYVQYNNSQFNPNGPHPQNFPSIQPGNYSTYPSNNPNLRPTNYPSNYPAFNASGTPSFNPSQRPAYHPGNPPTQNTPSRYPYYPNNSPTNPSYNPSQRPAYYQPGNSSYPVKNTTSQYPYQPGVPSYPSSYPTQYNATRPANPSYNPSQRPPAYPQNPSSSYNNHNSSSFNTTPRNSFGQYPNTYPNNPSYNPNPPPGYPKNPSSFNNFNNSSFNTTPRSSLGPYPNTYPNSQPYNPYPSGYNPAGFPNSNLPSNQPYNPYPGGLNPAGFPNKPNPFSNEDQLFKPTLPRGPSHAYDPNKSPAENFAYK